MHPNHFSSLVGRLGFMIVILVAAVSLVACHSSFPDPARPTIGTP